MESTDLKSLEAQAELINSSKTVVLSPDQRKNICRLLIHQKSSLESVIAIKNKEVYGRTIRAYLDKMDSILGLIMED